MLLLHPLQMTTMKFQNYTVAKKKLIDTHMLLHIKHDVDHSNQSTSFVVHIPDTDVLVLCLGHLHQINDNIKGIYMVAKPPCSI